MGYWHETLMQDLCLTHVSVLVCTDFLFVMEKCILFLEHTLVSKTWASNEAQHVWPVHSDLFFSRRRLKVQTGCQDSFSPLANKNQEKALHCSGCGSVSPNRHGLYLCFLPPSRNEPVGFLFCWKIKSRDVSISSFEGCMAQNQWKWHCQVCGAEWVRTLGGVWICNVLSKNEKRMIVKGNLECAGRKSMCKKLNWSAKRHSYIWSSYTIPKHSNLSCCDTFYFVLLHGSVNDYVQSDGNNHKHCLLRKQWENKHFIQGIYPFYMLKSSMPTEWAVLHEQVISIQENGLVFHLLSF